MKSAIPFSVCVFCGSRNGVNPAFVQDATQLGAGLAKAKMRLVYGAGDVGLMGAVANAAQTENGETFGVIPVHLLEMEVGKRDLTSLVITENMHERKKVMFMNADAIVTLPGGAGSLDEFFEVLTWRQLGLHNKPVYLLNTANYWQPLLDLIKHIVDQGFAAAEFTENFKVMNSVEELLGELTEQSSKTG